MQIWVHGQVPELNNEGGFIDLPTAAAQSLITAGKAHKAGSPFTPAAAGVRVAWHGWRAKIDPSAAPTFTVLPTVQGLQAVGSTITCDPGEHTGYPAPTITYQWTADGADIVGETGQTYISLVGDIGKQIRCEVTITNASGSATEASLNGIVPQVA